MYEGAAFMGWWNKFLHAHNVLWNAKKLYIISKWSAHRQFHCSFSLNFNIELDAEKKINK